MENVMLGRTVLMMAIQNEDVAMVELLLQHGADVNLIEFVYPPLDLDCPYAEKISVGDLNPEIANKNSTTSTSIMF